MSKTFPTIGRPGGPGGRGNVPFALTSLLYASTAAILKNPERTMPGIVESMTETQRKAEECTGGLQLSFLRLRGEQVES